jgi:cell wall-associated NlpC family hydrolase
LLTACGSHHATRSQSQVSSALHTQYNGWQGTPYRLGGLSKKGIDCSGFVYLTFKQRFGITLPRTTKAQVKQGDKISRRKLKPGDLVFFKTGWRTRHVGIYIGNGKFLHASTSKGVIISKLDNVYWKKKYWRAQRILE